ncbi:MAG TPA: 30S ribosome-binding factor RbfA, partial [Gemmatimonadaceae bacterium]|nr:30S ribosome-binding factor RbfA [Gemmatimonadaceae bacterium]
MADSRRADRVGEAIRAEVATFLSEGAKDPRLVGLVTVTAVEVSRDLRHARVFVTILGSDTERAASIDA